MDLISHALFSFLLCRLVGLSDGLLMIPILAGTLIDIDSVALLVGPGSYFRYHRGPVHSLLVVFGITITLILVGYLLFKTPLNNWKLFGVTLVAGIGHLVLDTLTPWGIALLWPLDSTKYTLDIIPFFEPSIFVLLLSSSILILFKPFKQLSEVQIVAIVLIFLFVIFSFRVYERGEAVDRAKLVSGSKYGNIYCFPTLRSDIWWAVTQEQYGSGLRYLILKINSLSQRVTDNRTVEAPYLNLNNAVDLPIDTPEKAAVWSRKASDLKAFYERARVPALMVSKNPSGKWEVFWYDIYLELQGGLMRGLMITLNSEGEIESNFIYR